MKNRFASHTFAPSRQQGIGLIEVMVAMTISLFLLLGLLMMFQSVRITAQAQTGIARLQENQRTAVNLLSNVVQSAGYFPALDVADPLVSVDVDALKNNVFPTDNPYVEGAGITGTDSSVRIRFQAPATDNAGKALNCHGEANQTANKVIYDNLFYVRDDQLVCALGADSKAVAGSSEKTLVTGLKTMSLDYGTDTDGNGSVTRYLKAANVTDWHAARTVRVTLTFNNPMAGQAGQPDTVETVHVIQLMGNS